MGRYCNDLLLTVSTEGSTTSNLPVFNNCRYGNIIKLEIIKSNIHRLVVTEIRVFGKQEDVQSKFRIVKIKYLVHSVLNSTI